MKRWIGATAIAASVLGTGAASAQDATYAERATAEGQDIRFKDDPLSAITSEPIGAQLTTFRPARRFDLMRPRTTFVPQMLMSVERL